MQKFTLEDIDTICGALREGLAITTNICTTENEKKWLAKHKRYIENLIKKVCSYRPDYKEPAK